MGKTQFSYCLPPLTEGEFPCINRTRGIRISCDIGDGNGVTIIGDSAGLLYLARHIPAMALIQNSDGLHVHLEPDEELDAGSSPLTICNRDFGFPGFDEENY